LVIYGVSILAGCMIAGLFVGEILGQLIGVQANVGGVGIAMLLMILLSDRLRRVGKMSPLTEGGVLFWSSIYIPVVVAMAAKQNVLAAVKGGPAAILAGAGAVVVSFALVPVLSQVGAPAVADPSSESQASGDPTSGLISPSQDHTPPCQDHTPASQDRSPLSDRNTPRSDGHTPRSNGSAPRSEGQTLRSDRHTPPSEGEEGS